jgi:hypothetical protein
MNIRYDTIDVLEPNNDSAHEIMSEKQIPFPQSKTDFMMRSFLYVHRNSIPLREIAALPSCGKGRTSSKYLC